MGHWESIPDDERKAYIAKHGGSESDAFDRYLEKRASSGIGTCNALWFRDGTTPGVDHQKPSSTMTKNENRYVEKLQSSGFKAHTILEDDKAPANIDLTIGDSG